MERPPVKIWIAAGDSGAVDLAPLDNLASSELLYPAKYVAAEKLYVASIGEIFMHSTIGARSYAVCEAMARDYDASVYSAAMVC